ncbi:hypothetical protein ABRP58_03260 [Pectobacterium aroidearum]|uniref:hypothetical protein n=1 Tax=Pectobacterium aroidearum TaxID=1201031 RepID=UPI0032EFF55A
MSSKNINSVIEKISNFRAVSSSIIDLQVELILELVKAIEEIQEKSDLNPSERELGQVDLYKKVSPIIKTSLNRIKEYNGSLKDDYVEAIKILSKIQKGGSNVD